jgi:hypothetical protein
VVRREESARAEAPAEHPQGRPHLLLPHGKGKGSRGPKDKTGKLSVVDVVPDKKLARAVTLAEIKADKAFASFPLVRMSRLSVMPVTDAEWKRIESMSRL